MSHGYHSLFHQLNLSNTCPYHLTRLIHECPKCHRKIAYLLSDEYPFQCCCGFSLITGVATTNFKIWSNFNTPEIIHEEYYNWLLLNKGNKKTSNILFELDLYKQEGRNFLGDLLTVFTSIKHKGTFNVVNIGISNKRNFNLLFVEDSVLKEKIYRASINTYKATIRHLKKTVLLKHKTCIARCKKGAPDDNVCPYAMAFLHWRMYIEGLNNIWEVENSNKRKVRNNIEFLSKQDKGSTIKIYQKLKENIYFFNSEEQLISILNRMFYLLIMNHFFNWLKECMVYESQRVLFHRIPFNYEGLPLFIIESKLNNQSEPSLIFWTFQVENKKFILSK